MLIFGITVLRKVLYPQLLAMRALGDKNKYMRNDDILNETILF